MKPQINKKARNGSDLNLIQGRTLLYSVLMTWQWGGNCMLKGIIKTNEGGTVVSTLASQQEGPMLDRGACKVILCGVSLIILSVSLAQHTYTIMVSPILILTLVLFYSMLITQNFQVSVSASVRTNLIPY